MPWNPGPSAPRSNPRSCFGGSWGQASSKQFAFSLSENRISFREGRRDASAARRVCEPQNTQVSKTSRRELPGLDLNEETSCSVHTISSCKTRPKPTRRSDQRAWRAPAGFNLQGCVRHVVLAAVFHTLSPTLIPLRQRCSITVAQME